MKKFSICLTIAFLCLFESLNAQNTSEGLTYMNNIMTVINKPKDEIWQYLKVVTRGKGAKKVESKRQILLTELNKAKNEVQRISKLATDDNFKTTTIKYLELSYTVLKEDYDKILDMEDIAEQSYDLMEAYMLAKEKASEKLDAASENLSIAQKEFAKKHNINLIEGTADKTSEKIKKAGEALSYYNDLYLIFFKSYKQEAYVLDAMQRNDINAFQQNTNVLSTTSSEGIEKAKLAENFKGDAMLKLALQKILTYFNTEAQKDFPQQMDFYIKKDNYEKAKKSFDALKPNDRTQPAVDQFNKVVNEYNAAAQKSNTMTATTNKNRSVAFDEWNKTVEKFFDSYSN